MQPAFSPERRLFTRVLPGDGPGRERGGVADQPTSGDAVTGHGGTAAIDFLSPDSAKSGAFQ